MSSGVISVKLIARPFKQAHLFFTKREQMKPAITGQPPEQGLQVEAFGHDTQFREVHRQREPLINILGQEQR